MTTQAAISTKEDQLIEMELHKKLAADQGAGQQSADGGVGKEKADQQVSTVWVRNCLGRLLASCDANADVTAGHLKMIQYL